jgi:hypothetical protein
MIGKKIPFLMIICNFSKSFFPLRNLQNVLPTYEIGYRNNGRLSCIRYHYTVI